MEQLTGFLLLNLEELVDLVASLTVRDTDVVLEVTVVIHEVEETIVRDVQLACFISKGHNKR